MSPKREYDVSETKVAPFVDAQRRSPYKPEIVLRIYLYASTVASF
jgi:hypothetical protein